MIDRRALAGVALVVGVALVAAGCADDADGSSPTATSSPAATASTESVTPPEQSAPPASDTVAADPAAAAVASFSGTPTVDGDVFVLYGRVTDRSGAPVADGVVEIWQTDPGGVYDHPDDPATADRDLAFQFYGAAAVDDEGWYAFRTILPGQYEPRPRHIHFKVAVTGEVELTSQFYFRTAQDGIDDDTLTAGLSAEELDLLLLDVGDHDGDQVARGDVVLDLGGGGDLAATPAQAEGPFYPVVDVADFDNDLTSTG